MLCLWFQCYPCCPTPFPFAKIMPFFQLWKPEAPIWQQNKPGKTGKSLKDWKSERKNVWKAAPWLGNISTWPCPGTRKGMQDPTIPTSGGRIHSLIAYKSIGTQLFPSLWQKTSLYPSPEFGYPKHCAYLCIAKAEASTNIPVKSPHPDKRAARAEGKNGLLIHH